MEESELSPQYMHLKTCIDKRPWSHNIATVEYSILYTMIAPSSSHKEQRNVHCNHTKGRIIAEIVFDITHMCSGGAQDWSLYFTLLYTLTKVKVYCFFRTKQYSFGKELKHNWILWFLGYHENKHISSPLSFANKIQKHEHHKVAVGLEQ